MPLPIRVPAALRLAAASVVLTASFAAAGGVEPPPSTPSFRGDAQVVLLDMVVRDGKGAPVLDLRPDEIAVYEDGRRCEIVSLRLVRPDAAAATPLPREGRPEPADAGPAATPAATAAAPVRPALVVLVFDELTGDAARRARTTGERFAATSFPAGTSFAVFKAGAGLRVLQPFTTDRSLLAPAVRAATSGADSQREGPLGTDVSMVSETLTEQAGRTGAYGGGIRTRSKQDEGPYTLAEIPAAMLYFIDSADRTRRGLGSLDGLMAIVKGLQQVQGRKTVVYFSEGLHTTADARGLYESLVAEANRSNVTFYNVDARGLTLSRPDRDSQALLDAAAAEAGRPSDVRQESRLTDAVAGNAQANLGVLATDTGGFLIANTDNVRPALERVADEVRSYYEAVYVPVSRQPDGRFRRIEARISRPHVTLRTRSGYFATPSGAPTLSASELPLLAALDAREPRRDFDVQSAVLGFRPDGGERECLLVVRVPLAAVQLAAEPGEERYGGHLSVLTLLKDTSGAVVARLLEDAPLSGPLAELERRRAGAAVFRHSLRLAPGRYALHTAVQDVAAGRLAVERREIVVPAAGAELGVSSVVVVQRATAAPGEAAPPDPLRVGRLVVTPELGRAALRPESRTLDYFLTLYPSRESAAPLELTLALRQQGRIVARALPSLPEPDGDGQVPLLGSLAIDSLAPGEYELEARARQGSAVAEALTGFEIRAAARSEAASWPPPDAELAGVLDRASEYTLGYERTFADLVAEEVYEQSTTGGAQRQTTRAEMVFAHLPGDIPWGSFRDVYEVDGQRVRDRDARLEKLFASGAGDASARAEAILRESARYNFGTAVRTVNLPTLPLLFLHPRNRGRFAFRRAGEEAVEGRPAVVVEFEETARPTVVRQGDGGGDLPAGGRFWIEARNGTVLRSETRFRFASAALATIRTEYRAAPELAAWVPAEMRERYEDLPGAPPVFRQTTLGVARYSGFRRFRVTTNEAGARPAPPRP